MDLKIKDIISIRDFSRGEIEYILGKAREMENSLDTSPKLLDGKMLGVLFFEPSTRTRLSFEAAMKRIGGKVIGFASSDISSVKKGESLVDTIRTIESYCDIIVIRHPKEGSARLAAQISKKPVINAGDGANQHPTQTLLDLYTIKREKGHFNVNVALVGDLKYGRAVHSLVYALAMMGADITMVSPPGLEMPEEVVNDIKGRGCSVEVSNSLEGTIPKADVLYITRIQEERFRDAEEYEKVKGAYKITLETLEKAKSDLIILHPLPKIDEIDSAVDSTPYARYFKQVYYGIPVRMAVLGIVMEVL